MDNEKWLFCPKDQVEEEASFDTKSLLSKRMNVISNIIFMVTSTLWLCFWVNSGPRRTYEPNSRRDLMSTEQEVHRAITFLCFLQ